MHFYLPQFRQTSMFLEIFLEMCEGMLIFYILQNVVRLHGFIFLIKCINKSWNCLFSVVHESHILHFWVKKILVVKLKCFGLTKQPILTYIWKKWHHSAGHVKDGKGFLTSTTRSGLLLQHVFAAKFVCLKTSVWLFKVKFLFDEFHAGIMSLSLSPLVWHSIISFTHINSPSKNLR